MRGNRKEGGRVCTVLFYVIGKAIAHPRIRTRPTQAECHRSSTCAYTTSYCLSNPNICPELIFQPCRQEASQRPQVFSGDRPSGHALHPLEAVPPRIRLQLKGLDQGHLPVGGPRHVALAPPELHFKGSVLLKLSSWLLGWRYRDSLITPSSPVRIPLLRGSHFLCIILVACL